MARDRDVVGEGTSNRLSGRLTRDGVVNLDKSALTKQSMPGGGEVYSGPVAQEALETLGARAMTVDQSIIVADDFNPSRASDQALFAHEQHHLEHSGGEGGHTIRDAEEVEARAIESMVLQRSAVAGSGQDAAGSAAMTGGYEAGYAPGAGKGAHGPGHAADQGGRGVAAGVQSSDGKPDPSRADPDPVRGYQALTKKGLTRVDIVERLAREVVSTLDERRVISMERGRDKKSW
jgi:hypothetical protein